MTARSWTCLILSLFFLSLLLPGACRADTILLETGQLINGEIVEETPEKILLKVEFGTITYFKKEIKEIRRAGTSTVSQEASKFRDVLKLRSGEVHECLLVKETPEKVVVDLIASGKRVSKTIMLQAEFDRKEIVSLKKITDAERDAARKYLSEVDREAEVDRQGADDLVLKPIKWDATLKGKKVQVPAFKVELEYFVVEANLEEDFLRKCMHGMEKVFDAFKDHFGVDRNETVKIRVLIFNSMEQYYTYVPGGMKNPAFYSPDHKFICAGCDVAQFDGLVKEIRKKHGELSAHLRAVKAGIAEARMNLARAVKEYNDKIFTAGKTTPQGMALYEAVQEQKRNWQKYLAEQGKIVEQVEDEIYQLNVRNDIVFQDVTQSMFETLYHEAFHAFVDNFLFSEDLAKAVPRWLHEGMAQYFESARVEKGRLILGQMDRRRISMLKQWQKDRSIMPVSKVIGADAEGFIVHNIANLENSTRHYLQSWVLVHWLGEHKRLEKNLLTSFVGAVDSKMPAAQSLQILTGLSYDAFQKEIDKKLSYDFALRENESKKDSKESIPAGSESETKSGK